MIVIYVNSMEDTSRLKKAYEGLEDVTLLYNPTRNEVVEELENNKDPLVMCLGHGTTSGLFATNWLGYVVDRNMIDFLKDRKMIGIWCYASSFAERYGLHGYFTSMFISNINEAEGFGFAGHTNEDILNEVDLFSESIHSFLKEGVPMEQWVDLLKSSCHQEKDFVRFNYEGMRWRE